MGTQHGLCPRSHDEAFRVFSTKIFNVIAVFLAPVFNKNSNAKESRYPLHWKGIWSSLPAEIGDWNLGYRGRALGLGQQCLVVDPAEFQIANHQDVHMNYDFPRWRELITIRRDADSPSSTLARWSEI